MAGFLLIVDDNAPLLRSFRRLLKPWLNATGFTLSTVETTGEARFLLQRRHRLHGAIIDVFLGDELGVDLLEELRRERGAFPALVATAAWGGLPPAIANRVASLDAHLIAKPIGPEILSPFLALVASGGKPFGSDEGLLIDWIRSLADPPLTRQERRVLGAIGMFTSNKEAAEKLTIQLPTLKTHIASILRKTGASQIDELFSRARDKFGARY